MFIKRTWILLQWRLGQIAIEWWIILGLVAFFEIIRLIWIKKKPCFMKTMYLFLFIDYLYLVIAATVISREVIDERYWNQLISFDVSTAWSSGSGIFGAIDTANESILNVLMFVPLGYLLARLAGGRRWIPYCSCLLITLSIEMLQLITKRGFFELADILLNMIGACLGCMVYSIFTRIKSIENKSNSNS